MEPASGAAVGLCPWQGDAPGCLVPIAVPTRVLGCDVNTHRSWGVICSYTGPGVRFLHTQALGCDVFIHRPWGVMCLQGPCCLSPSPRALRDVPFALSFN